MNTHGAPAVGHIRSTIVLLFVVFAVGPGQDWIARYSTGQYHDDSGRALAVDYWGNSYVAGYADPKGIIVIKYSPQGETLWVRTVTKSSYSNFGGMGAAIGLDGNLFVAQLVRSGTQNGFHILRYRPDGTCLLDSAFWHTDAGGDFPGSYPVNVVVAASGAYYVNGTTQSESTSFDIVTSRFHSNGMSAWTRFFDGQRHDWDAAYDLALDAAGNVLTVGGATDASNYDDAVVLSYDSTGTQQWNYVHLPNTGNRTRALSVTANGTGIYVAGTSRSNSLALKLSTAGDSLWSRTDDSSEAHSVVLTSGGNMVSVGLRYLPGWRVTMRAWSYSPSGQLAWRQDYRGTDTMSTFGYFAATNDGQSVYAAGARLPDAIHHDYLVAKYDAAGTKLWSAFGGDSSDTHSEIPNATATDREGGLILTGVSKHTDGTEEILTMKFRSSGAVEEQPASPAKPQPAIVASPSVVSGCCRFILPAGDRQSSLTIADVSGRAVRTLPVSGRQTLVTWDVRDEAGQPVPNGIYFVRLASGVTHDASSVAKLIVQR